MFKLATLAALVASSSALRADSTSGQNLLSKARNLEEGYYSWIVDYSIQFASCHKVNNYNFDQDGGDESATGFQNLVKFNLVPTGKCTGSTAGAEYVIPMDTFIDSYTEWQLNDQEYKCEQIRENCECEYYGGDDEDACENKCYVDAGMSSCIEEEKDDDGYEFNLQEWLECREAEIYNSNGEPYYVGPKCSSSKQGINLAVFTDQYCTQEYDDGVWTKAYGYRLPYSSKSLVSEYCISCTQENNDNNNNNNNNGYYAEKEITEICEESYVAAAKCETNLNGKIASIDTSGCDYVNNLYLNEVGYKPVNAAAAIAVAVFFGIGCVALAGVAGKLYLMNQRQIDLNNDDAAIV
jgi:hypothetical protein